MNTGSGNLNQSVSINYAESNTASSTGGPCGSILKNKHFIFSNCSRMLHTLTYQSYIASLIISRQTETVAIALGEEVQSGMEYKSCPGVTVRLVASTGLDLAGWRTIAPVYL